MTEEVKLKRVQCNYETQNSRFLLDCDFSKQYHHYYNRRLARTRPYLEFNCRNKWPTDIPILSLAELAAMISLYGDHGDGWVASQSQSSLLASTPPKAPRSQSSSIFSPSSSAELANFKYSKRLRKFSDSLAQSPAHKSSTQRAQQEINLFKTPEMCKQSVDLISPIAPLNSNSDAEDEQSEQHDYIIIGTIFKRMKLQPDVIQELSEGDFHVRCERYLGHYTCQDDKLVLEDPEETIALVGNIEPGKLVTGVNVALLGYPLEDGSQFFVRDICFAEPNKLILYDDEDEDEDDAQDMKQREESVSSGSSLERPLACRPDPVFLMVVSGFGFHQDLANDKTLTSSLQSLIDFVWGGGEYNDDERSYKVARILVVGDNLLEDRLLPNEDNEIGDPNLTSNELLAQKMKRSRQVKPYTNSIQAIKHMDNFFAQLSKTINVDVMPGPSDPSSHLIPQQPFHPCMFPKSCMFATFNCSTNPHHGIYDDKVEILATSGQNIDIISKFSCLTDPIEIMKCHLKWGNSAPSAPDNLYSVPYEDDDPHVIDFIPDIYIAGCQEYYQTDYHTYEQTKLIEDLESSQNKESKNVKSDNKSRKDRTLLITVPKFHETYSCVLINLKTLESQLMSFRS